MRPPFHIEVKFAAYILLKKGLVSLGKATLIVSPQRIILLFRELKALGKGAVGMNLVFIRM